jgi:predicted helicase
MAFDVVLNKKYTIVAEHLLNKAIHWVIMSGGGTEFYDRCIIGLVEPYLEKMNIDHKVLTRKEIDLMNRCERLKNIPNIGKIMNIFNQLRVNDIIQKYRIEPKEHQQYILKNIKQFYNLNDIGKIVWACGLGKSLLSILIVKLLRFKSVLIGVPSNNLQKQIRDEILKVFPNTNNILFVGSDIVDRVRSTTNKNQISQFLGDDILDPKFVISTYHSCHLLVDSIFDFKIGDEAHHLVGIEESNGFRAFHKINSKKSLFMTATEKSIEIQTNKVLYSMEDETVFGKYIDIKSVHWAIENKKITDYNILILKNTDSEVNEIISSMRLNVINKDLFLSCYMCLKSFEKYDDLTHLLLYTNTTENAELSKKYIDEILLLNILSIPKELIYNNSLHSRNCKDLVSEVYKFKNTSYGIISCVYIFGEGFDLPKLNGICIAGNMQSETRIVQYILRPNRLDSKNPNKKAYVIIPYIDSDDWNIENRSYERVRNIISQMRNVDETIERKISVSVGKNHKKQRRIKSCVFEDYSFEENIGELNKIKLRLRYSKALSSKFTEEQDEYNYIRSINSSLNIRSKTEYIQLRDIHSNFIDHPEEYFKLKGVWDNWYDFMGVDISKFI